MTRKAPKREKASKPQADELGTLVRIEYMWKGKRYVHDFKGRPVIRFVTVNGRRQADWVVIQGGGMRVDGKGFHG